MISLFHHLATNIRLLITLATLLPSITTHTVYTVTPDDHYYPNTTCHHCHNLQHYLLNVTKYFASNTQLLFLPGLHHLHTDLIIQNFHNISLIGSTANGTTLDTAIIQCNSSVGITLSNITDLTMEKLIIENCEIEKIKNVPDRYLWTVIRMGMFLSHCYNIQLHNVAVYSSEYRSTVLAINVLGISSFINLTSSGLVIQYNEMNVNHTYNKLLIENYLLSFHAKVFRAIIIIQLHQESYKVELEIYNTKFTAINTTTRLFDIIQTANTFRNFIHFNELIVEKFNFGLMNDLFKFEAFKCLNENYTYSLITFTNCVFKYNIIGRLFTVIGYFNMKLQSCMFKYNHFQVIRNIDSSNQNSIVITNTTFYAIMTNSYLIHISGSLLHLEGPVVFAYVKADRILYVKHTISCHGYIEFSENIATFNDHIDYITVQENTLINMTNNEYRNIYMINKQYYSISNHTIISFINIPYHEAFSIYNFTAPCYYQYTAEGQNFDQLTEKLNFSIVFHNDIFIYSIMTSHCRWLPGSAFNSTKPMDINNRLIKSDFTLAHDKLFCYCDNNDAQDCYTDTLTTAYPGQTISLPLVLNYKYSHFTEPIIEIDIIYDHFFTVEINDNVLPQSACKVAKVNELIHKIYYRSCSVINLTIVHNELSYLQWCELFIKNIKTNQIDVYYIDILSCPTGFVQQNGICICDPILNSALLQIIACDINDQTILRPAGSWLSATTINDSHQYYISPHCPLHYCLPQSSQFNFSTPNSQCQFNRDGMLCGQCQQGLSTVFGYSHCQHCSNVYLLLVIPIAVAGLVLVLLLFILNLTVTDGDINGFILYVNIISINSHVFFPQCGNSINILCVFISLVNLDLGIPTCFYNGMDDYAKMWLQLAFPAYFILIATLLIIASRHSITVQRITACRALPVLATLFLLSYTKVLCTVSSVLFYYSTITHLPSGHNALVWAADANVPLFGLKYTALFIVCLVLFIILLPFNVILCFTKSAMRLKLVNHFKPLIDAYQGPYKYKYYYWTGLQFVMRAVFFGLSALDRNINLTVGIILLAIIIIIQRSITPFKDNYKKNLHETTFLFNLLVIYALSHDQYDTAVNVMITMALLQFLLIIIHHINSNVCGGVIMYKLRITINSTVKWITRSWNKPKEHIHLNNAPPDKAYNYQELREPLVGLD